MVNLLFYNMLLCNVNASGSDKAFVRYKRRFLERFL